MKKTSAEHHNFALLCIIARREVISTKLDAVFCPTQNAMGDSRPIFWNSNELNSNPLNPSYLNNEFNF